VSVRPVIRPQQRRAARLPMITVQAKMSTDSGGSNRAAARRSAANAGSAMLTRLNTHTCFILHVWTAFNVRPMLLCLLIDAQTHNCNYSFAAIFTFCF